MRSPRWPPPLPTSTRKIRIMGIKHKNKRLPAGGRAPLCHTPHFLVFWRRGGGGAGLMPHKEPQQPFFPSVALLEAWGFLVFSQNIITKNNTKPRQRGSPRQGQRPRPRRLMPADSVFPSKGGDGKSPVPRTKRSPQEDLEATEGDSFDVTRPALTRDTEGKPKPAAGGAGDQAERTHGSATANAPGR